MPGTFNAFNAAYEGPGGWSLSPIAPAQILKIFSSLSLRGGFALRAYLHRGSDGRGIVWALPEDKALPDPSQSSKLPRRLFLPFKPLAALRDHMEAIEGDGTPFSYLSASIVSRELAEFGRTWHNTSWGTETILGKDPWIEPPPGDARFCEFRPDDPWKLEAPRPAPDEWAPRVQLDEDYATVSFFTFSGHINQEIRRITDRFSVGSYVFKTEATRLAIGPPGYRF